MEFKSMTNDQLAQAMLAINAKAAELKAATDAIKAEIQARAIFPAGRKSTVLVAEAFDIKISFSEEIKVDQAKAQALRDEIPADVFSSCFKQEFSAKAKELKTFMAMGDDTAKALAAAVSLKAKKPKVEIQPKAEASEPASEAAAA